MPKPPTFDEIIAKLHELETLTVAQRDVTADRQKCQAEVIAMFGSLDQQTPGMTGAELDAFRESMAPIRNKLTGLAEGRPPTTAPTPPQGADDMAGPLDDLRDDFNDATNKVADRIDKLLAANVGSMTPQQQADFRAEMTVIRDHLRALGADPQNPIPPEPPPPPPAGARKP